MTSWNTLDVHMAACPECQEWAARKVIIRRWRKVSWPVGCIRFWQLFKAACREDDNGKADQIKA